MPEIPRCAILTNNGTGFLQALNNSTTPAHCEPPLALNDNVKAFLPPGVKVVYLSFLNWLLFLPFRPTCHSEGAVGDRRIPSSNTTVQLPERKNVHMSFRGSRRRPKNPLLGHHLSSAYAGSWFSSLPVPDMLACTTLKQKSVVLAILGQPVFPGMVSFRESGCSLPRRGILTTGLSPSNHYRNNRILDS